MTIPIHTNGSIRNEEYHFKMATIHKKFNKRSCIRYGVDGLGDVHSFYRQNTSFDKCIKNMNSAISGGARVIWQYLIFPWNVHQKSEAKDLAEKMGCSEFWARPDRSFVSNLGKHGVLERKLKKFKKEETEVPFKISPPKIDEKVICRFLRNNEGTLFLSWDGRIWPCCFHANTFYEKDEKIKSYKSKVLAGYDDNFNSLLHHSFDEILRHPFFSNHLMKSWESTQDSRNWRCIEKCRSTKIRESDQKLDHENESGLQKTILNRRNDL